MSNDNVTDVQDIQEVLTRYATAIDQRDWELFGRCFTDDVVADYDGIGRWEGVAPFAAFMREVHAELGATLHRLSNMAIQLLGDGATARTYVDAVILTADGQPVGNPIGYYDDDLVRTDEGWRVRRRTFTAVQLSSGGGQP